MSANLDLVPSIFADWERGDFWSVDWAHPEIKLVTIGALVDESSTGVAGMAERWREGVNAWEDAAIRAEEYRELDTERVLVLVRFSARGKTSGLELGGIASRGAGVFDFCDGKVTKLVFYRDRERALADVGLAPEGDSQDS